MAGCGPHEVATVVRIAAPVGVHSSMAGAPGGPAYDGTPRQQLGDRGRRDRHRAVGARDRGPTRRRPGETTTSLDRQVDEAGTRADHVGDRVEGADLVEGDVGGSVAVGPAPRPRRAARRCASARRATGSSRSASQQQRPMSRQERCCAESRDLDVAAGGGEAVADDLLDPELHRLGRDRVDGALEHVERVRRRRRGRRAACRRSRRRRRRPRPSWVCRADPVGRTRAAKTPAP